MIQAWAITVAILLVILILFLILMKVAWGIFWAALPYLLIAAVLGWVGWWLYNKATNGVKKM